MDCPHLCSQWSDIIPGAGNIGHDAKVYAAGDITREGIEGVSADGEYSTGRGGAGNIGLGDGVSPTGSGMNTPTHEPRRFSLLPSSRSGSRARGGEDRADRSRSRSRVGASRLDEIVVPETATRRDDYKDFHTGVRDPVAHA